MYLPNLSAQAQKFRIFEKKLSLDVRSPWYIQIPNIYLGLGFEFEFEPQISKDLAIMCP